jgi:hypothetical protein
MHWLRLNQTHGVMGATSGHARKHGAERPGGSSAVLWRLQEHEVMTKDQKVIRAKVGLLELATQLGDVSQACKMMGHSRDSF